MLNQKKGTAKPERRKADRRKKAASNDLVPAEEIRMAALAMSEMAVSLHELVSFLRENPQITELPDAMRELSKRISVLSTRL